MSHYRILPHLAVAFVIGCGAEVAQLRALLAEEQEQR